MIELLYPVLPAPITGPRQEECKLLPVVDEVGRVYARASEERCDEVDSPLLHPAVYLQLVDRAGRFFLKNGVGVSFAENVPYGKSFDDVLAGMGCFNSMYVASYVPQLVDKCLLVQLYVALASSVEENGKWLPPGLIESSVDLSDEFRIMYSLFGDKILAFL